MLLFVINIIVSRKQSKDLPPVGADPWDARTIEWMVPSPTPEYNFSEIPTITRVDDFWYRKYGETPDHKLVRIAKTEDVVQKRTDGKGIHLPSPSYWPIVVAFGLPIVGYGLIFSLWLCLVGGLIVVGGLYGWVMEPPDDPDAAHDDHGPESHDSHDGASADASAGDAPAIEAKEVETVG